MERLVRNQVDNQMDALLAEGQDYFMGAGGIHDAASTIAGLLADLAIDYAIAGALALGEHGYTRRGLAAVIPTCLPADKFL